MLVVMSIFILGTKAQSKRRNSITRAQRFFKGAFCARTLNRHGTIKN